MADFMKAQPYVLKYEGGYVYDPLDHGGETYRGISRIYFPKWAGWELVDGHKPLLRGEIIESHLLEGMVGEFYKTQLWDNMRGDQIESQGVGTYLYDFYVNAGRNAVKCMQRVLGVTDDGIIGPGTLAAINKADNLLERLHESRVGYYTRIATGTNARFLKGWMNRANSLYEALK